MTSAEPRTVAEKAVVPAAHGKARKKLLFVTPPLKGHLVHTVRLLEWFMQYPDEYELHVGVHADAFKDLPDGCTTHALPDCDGESLNLEYWEKAFKDVGQTSSDW